MAGAQEYGREAFLAWAAGSLPPSRCKWLQDHLHKVEQFARSNRLISGTLYEVRDAATLQAIDRACGKSKLFQLQNRGLLRNILDDFHLYMQYCAEQTQVTAAPEAEEAEPARGQDIPEQASGEEQARERGEAAKQSASEPLVVDFAKLSSLVYTRPLSASFRGKALPKPSAWKDIYVGVLRDLWEDHAGELRSLRASSSGKNPEFGAAEDADKMIFPQAISDELWVETNYSTTVLMGKVQKVLKLCGVPLHELRITYEPRFRTEGPPEMSLQSFPSVVREEDYLAFLKNNVHLADRSCAAYATSIRGAQRYADAHGYVSCTLFDVDRETCKATVRELYGDPAFIQLDRKQHYRFRVAINQLLAFLGTETPPVANPPAGKEDGGEQDKAATAISEETLLAVSELLRKRFRYGCKYDSFLDRQHFRSYAENLGTDLPEGDEELQAAILAAGIRIGDRVYPRDEEMLRELREMVEDAFASGAQMLYYTCLHEKEQAWMEAHAIPSPELLMGYLQHCIRGCSFGKKYLFRGSKCKEIHAVTAEIRRVWGEGQLRSVEEMYALLPYIENDSIRQAMWTDSAFVRNSEGVYLLIDRFTASPEAQETILTVVARACDAQGYASLSALPLEELEEENYELTPLAIREAVWLMLLDGKYHRNGKIITRNAPELDAATLLWSVLRERDEWRFEDAKAKLQELTGHAWRRDVFSVLYGNMVRVDRERFVADRRVHFDVEGIDAQLAKFVRDRFCAIRDVTTFALFPGCGQGWNHYLLESYCCRFSRKYRLCVYNFNDKNVGAIVERDFPGDYEELLAIAAARSDVELTSEAVAQYLVDAGYMVKHVGMEQTIQRVAEIRKGA